MKTKQTLIVLGLSLLGLASCCSPQGKPTIKIIETSAPKVISLKQDSGNRMSTYLAPFVKEEAEQMNVVIGQSAMAMNKALPEGLLNNWIAKLMFVEASKLQKVDIAISNYGGIRRDLHKGDLTIGDIFEIAPFDNSLVVLKLSGKSIVELAHNIAHQGGEAVYGMRFGIRDRRAENVKVNGAKVVLSKDYYVVTTDYLSYGNDGLKALAESTQTIALKVFMRDAMIQYVKDRTAENKQITSEIIPNIYEIK